MKIDIKSTAQKLIVAAGLVGISTLSHADWQYTKWGMTEAQVVAASKGTAVPVSDADKAKSDSQKIKNPILLEARYSSGKFDFTARFQFDRESHKLVGVSLKLLNVDSQKISDLADALKLKYGEPQEVDRRFFLTVTWNSGDDQLTYLVGAASPPDVVIHYQPLRNTDNSGL